MEVNEKSFPQLNKPSVLRNLEHENKVERTKPSFFQCSFATHSEGNWGRGFVYGLADRGRSWGFSGPHCRVTSPKSIQTAAFQPAPQKRRRLLRMLGVLVWVMFQGTSVAICIALIGAGKQQKWTPHEGADASPGASRTFETRLLVRENDDTRNEEEMSGRKRDTRNSFLAQDFQDSIIGYCEAISLRHLAPGTPR